MKKLAVASFALFTLQAPAWALVDLPREFANCAGRYSAMMEHAWLMQASVEAEEYQRLRSAFVSLLEATDSGPGEVTFHRRVDAKAAQAHLLHVATFSDDPERAGAARDQSETHLSLCRQLVLGG